MGDGKGFFLHFYWLCKFEMASLPANSPLVTSIVCIPSKDRRMLLASLEKWNNQNNKYKNSHGTETVPQNAASVLFLWIACV